MNFVLQLCFSCLLNCFCFCFNILHGMAKDYTSEGMIILLQLVTEALIKNKTSKSPNYKLSTLGFGCQQKWIDHIQKSLRFAMPIIISVAYIPSAVIVACEMTKENTRNMKVCKSQHNRVNFFLYKLCL